jgi:hypothetical protein
VCPATKKVVARQYTHVHPGVSAKAGEAVTRKKYKGAVQGFVVEAGGRLGPAAKKFIDEVVAECETSEVARKAVASKIVRAIGIEVMHKQANMMATLIQELRNEERFMADFANGVVSGRASLDDNGFLSVVHIWGFLVFAYSYTCTYVHVYDM